MQKEHARDLLQVLTRISNILINLIQICGKGKSEEGWGGIILQKIHTNSCLTQYLKRTYV